MTAKIFNHSLLRQAKDIVGLGQAKGLAAALVAEDEVRTVTLVDSQVSEYFLAGLSHLN